jgi:lipopolysaccharide transport system permease protein
LVLPDLRELWRFRELFVLLAWRDIAVRYKQTALGVSWAIFQPLLTTVIFSVIFGRMAGFSSAGAPYVMMTYVGLLPWQFFANAVTESSNSVVLSANVISKVYFPRLIIPASAVLSGFVDLAVGLGLLLPLLWWYGLPLRPSLLVLPLLVAAACAVSLAIGIWLSALTVKFRDVKYIVPFFTRLGLYVSPVAFSSLVVLEKLGPRAAFWYWLNPMAGIIEGFRWSVLGTPFAPSPGAFGLSLAGSLLLLILGTIYFRSTERRFADYI